MIAIKKMDTSTKIIAIAFIVVLCYSISMPHNFSFGLEQTGSIVANVKYANGERVSAYGTVLKVYQDTSQTPFKIIKPDSFPVIIDSLPMDHRYKIDTYKLDMYGSSQYVELKDNPSESVDITIPLDGALIFRVFYNDGITPIEGINISVKSNNGTNVAQGTTDDEGKSNQFWLQSTNRNLVSFDKIVREEPAGYYIASFSLGPNLNYTYNQQLSVTANSRNTIDIVTPWPTVIGGVHVSIYTPENQKVGPSDGKFLVLLSDKNTGTKIGQSDVIHGDAYFSKLTIGDYLFHIVKINQNLNGTEVGSLDTTLDGTKSQFSVILKNLTGGSPIDLQYGVVISQNNAITPTKYESCNCIIFRLDDVQDHFVSYSQSSILNLFLLKNINMTLGVITNSTGDNPVIVGAVKEGVKKGIFDLALHGYNHIDYSKLDAFSQWQSLSEAQEKLKLIFGNNTDLFIPPYNHFDNSTIDASERLGIRLISAGATSDKLIYHYSKDKSSDMTKMYHVPQQSEFPLSRATEINYLSEITPAQVLEDVNINIKNYGYAVITLHPQDFANKDSNGRFITGKDGLNFTQLQSLVTLFDDLKAKNIHFTTFRDLTGLPSRTFPDVGNSSLGVPDDPLVTNLFTLGKGPAGISVNSITNTIYVTNSKSSSVSVIDGSIGALLDNVGVGDIPVGISVNPTTNMIYVVNSHSNTVSVINGSTNTASDLPGIKSLADGLAINSLTNTIYVIDPYTSSVDFIDGNTNKVLHSVKVDNPRRIAVNPTTNMIYVTNSKSDSVTVIDGSTNTAMKTIQLSDNDVTVAIAVNPTTNMIYVTNSKSDSVTVIDGSTNTAMKTIQLDQAAPPLDVSADSLTNLIYVTHPTGTVSVIDGTANTVVREIHLGAGAVPLGIAINSKTDTVYIADSKSNTIGVIDGNIRVDSAVPEFNMVPLLVISISFVIVMIFSSFKKMSIKMS